MLAYVFWHWSAPNTIPSTYEDHLRAFHRALAQNPSQGFIGSAAFRIEGALWLPQMSAYEDWYLVNDFGALGTLNEAAVSGARKNPHDDAARMSAGGTAGLYRPVLGEPEFPSARFAVWVAKPSNISYDQFFDDARLWLHGKSAVLWQRQMTLGPTSEFCLQSAERITVPQRFAPVAVELTLVTAAGQPHRRAQE